MRPTLEELQQFAQYANPNCLQAIVEGAAEMERMGINTPIRLAHFLGQCAHETNGFAVIREDTSWTAKQMCALWPSRFKTPLDPRIVMCKGDPDKLANLAYSNRQDLGNTGGDDGWAYRGGGFIQITGRQNYKNAGDAIGVDLEGAPELIEDPGISLQAALWYWTKLNINALADLNYGRAVSNAVNRGYPYSSYEAIGRPGREKWTSRAWSIWGEGRPPMPEELRKGAAGPLVGLLQSKLVGLGYAVGAQDNIYGPTLARAVAAFKADNGHTGELEPGDRIGAATWAALDIASPVAVSPERANATEQDLADKGSTEVAAGRKAKIAGQTMLYAGMAQGAAQTGLLGQATDMMVPVKAFHATLVPTLAAVQWGLSHAFWVAIVLGGVWFWTKGRHIISARLQAHRLGFNLFR
jgi:putative chitinase